MNPRERILAIRLFKSQKVNKCYFDKIGVEVKMKKPPLEKKTNKRSNK